MSSDTSSLRSVASSRLSSPMSRSPTPPAHLVSFQPPYPSPPCSQPGSRASPYPDSSQSICVSLTERDGPPPAKRRRLIAKMPRDTKYLNLHNNAGDVDADQRRELDRLLEAVHKKRKIVVVAGAGISVSAGSTLSQTKSMFRH